MAATIMVGLFIMLVASLAVPEIGSRGADEGTFDPVYPRPSNHFRASSVPAYDEGERVPVFCHHFLRRDANPFELVKILGALFLNLPLLDDLDVWTQTASAFERQIVYLKENGYTSIGMDELVAWRSGSIELPERSAVITFDDGSRSVLEIAYPILKKHGMKATLFVVTGEVGREWQGIDVMTWGELRLLQSSGVFTIESHTHGLHHIVRSREGHLPFAIAVSEAGCPPSAGVSWQEAILADLTESRRLIAAHLGHDARHLAWPYGGTNAELDSLAALAGFRSMATLEDGVSARLPEAGIKRYLITARTSMRSYSAMLPH